MLSAAEITQTSSNEFCFHGRSQKQQFQFVKKVLGHFLFISCLFATVSLCAAALSSPHADSFSKEIRPLLDQYCIKCHGPGKIKGGVNLNPFTNSISVYRDIKLWERVAAKV